MYSCPVGSVDRTGVVKIFTLTRSTSHPNGSPLANPILPSAKLSLTLAKNQHFSEVSCLCIAPLGQLQNRELTCRTIKQKWFSVSADSYYQKDINFFLGILVSAFIFLMSLVLLPHNSATSNVSGSCDCKS